MKVKSGMVIGGWKLCRRLGKGGNGVVFEAIKNESRAALKILNNPNRLERFTDEIRVMKLCQEVAGVLPLYDSFLSYKNEKTHAWFAMAIATPMHGALGNEPSLIEVVNAIAGVARSLVNLHELGVAHRDIKPDNLFFYNGEWVVGDLGLATFDEKTALTLPLEKVGPIYYIAPEMLNSAIGADGKPADVYSLAKTLWVLSTGQRYPLPGHQVTSVPALTLGSYSSDPRAALLDPLIETATNPNPKLRPSIKLFLQELDAWLEKPMYKENSGPLDTFAFKRLLEGRAARVHASSIAITARNEQRNTQGLRIRERFRSVASELLEALKEASFISPSLNIDSYFYGFEISATVPYEIEEKDFYRISIILHTNPEDPDGSRFHLLAWYKCSTIKSGATSEIELWHSRRDFLASGADEDLQIITMERDLKEQFSPSVSAILALAGLIPAET